MKKVILNLQYACNDKKTLPNKSILHHWLQTVVLFCKIDKKIELTIRMVDPIEIRTLNWIYRGINHETNVLSFPFESPFKIIVSSLIGDLVICPQVVTLEAIKQHKTIESCWAHVVIHGTLHLLGFDHLDDKEAEKMERLETQIINNLGYPNPYIS